MRIMRRREGRQAYRQATAGRRVAGHRKRRRPHRANGWWGLGSAALIASNQPQDGHTACEAFSTTKGRRQQILPICSLSSSELGGFGPHWQTGRTWLV